MDVAGQRASAGKKPTRFTATLSSVPQLKLGKADLELTVRLRGKQYGVLAISRGALVWRPSRSGYEYKMRWRELDEFAVDRGEALRRARHGNRRRPD
jgi:hypothetical protein